MVDAFEKIPCEIFANPKEGSRYVANEIATLKAKSDKDMYVFGSANLSETLIQENLFDEYRIGIAPVIAGKGRYLFPKGLPEKKLSLKSSQPLMTGGVILTYKALSLQATECLGRYVQRFPTIRFNKMNFKLVN